ncbi:unnamed protein product, partial [marine sediment metagenome]
DKELLKLTAAEAQRWHSKLGVDAAIWYDKEEKERNKGVDNVHKVLDAIMKIKEIDGQH